MYIYLIYLSTVKTSWPELRSIMIISAGDEKVSLRRGGIAALVASTMSFTGEPPRISACLRSWIRRRPWVTGDGVCVRSCQHMREQRHGSLHRLAEVGTHLFLNPALRPRPRHRPHRYHHRHCCRPSSPVAPPRSRFGPG